MAPRSRAASTGDERAHQGRPLAAVHRRADHQRPIRHVASSRRTRGADAAARHRPLRRRCRQHRGPAARAPLFHAEDVNTARSAATRAAIESVVFAPPSVRGTIAVMFFKLTAVDPLLDVVAIQADASAGGERRPTAPAQDAIPTVGSSRQGDDGTLGIPRCGWHPRRAERGCGQLLAGRPPEAALSQSRLDVDRLAADGPQRPLHRRDYETEHTHTSVGL